MKTSISLPGDLVSAADTLAEHLGVSRNDLFATALAEFIAKHDEHEVTARLNRVYAAEASTLDPALHQAQLRSLESW